MAWFAALLLGLLAPATALVLPYDVGKTPALGWNSWNAYGCDIDAEKFLDAADLIVSLGLKDAGYEYVNIDDCWSEKTGRDPSTQQLIPNATRFPSGISGVAEQVHDLGLKIGIYSSAGNLTCAGYPASLGYEEIDAATWSAWGIDYVKYDNCYVPENWLDPYNACVPDDPAQLENSTCIDLVDPAPAGYNWSSSLSAERYRRMSKALRAQNRTMLYSLCEWGDAEVWTWASTIASSFRMSGDITPYWSRVAQILNENSFLMNYVDFWTHPDPDMLEIGNGMTLAEERSHFGFWAIMKSPLLIGTDLSQISNESLAILKNPYLLAFNQDNTYGGPATPYKWGINPDWTFNASFPAEYWAGASSQGVLVAMLNTLNQTTTKTLQFDEVPALQGNGSIASFELLDVWTGQALGCFSGTWNATLEAHDTAVVLVNVCP